MWLAIALAGGILLVADAWTAQGGSNLFFAAALVGILAAGRVWDNGSAALVSVSLLAAAVAVNVPFYARLCRSRGLAFVLLAVPLHIVHYLVCGSAFVAGSGLHAWVALRGPNRARGDQRSSARLVDSGGGCSAEPSSASRVEEQPR
jgi:hypothetical protein